MDVRVPYRLTFLQKLRLALSVFTIYWPIRLYVNIAHWSWETLEDTWLLWILEIILTISFFIFWLAVTEWLEQKFAHLLPNGFQLRFSFAGQLANLVVAGALAVVFNTGFHQLWHWTNHLTDNDGERREVMMSLPSEKESRKRSGFSDRHDSERDQRRRANNGLMMIAMLSAFYLAANWRSVRQLEELRVKAEQLKREATQAQFAALKNQVNPHFLFNSLSILSSLVEVDTRLSIQFISRLSKAYRYILEQRDSERVSLKTELDFLDSYTFLLNIRFDGKLKIVQHVSAEDALTYGIAPLTLQLLVENAVKHNQMSAEKPLLVTIQTDGDYLTVSNPLQLRPQEESSTGLGLENIANRYRLLTDLPVWSGEENGSFVIRIPLLS
jgi:hypothetical protein